MCEASAHLNQEGLKKAAHTNTHTHTHTQTHRLTHTYTQTLTHTLTHIYTWVKLTSFHRKDTFKRKQQADRSFTRSPISILLFLFFLFLSFFSKLCLCQTLQFDVSEPRDVFEYNSINVTQNKTCTIVASYLRRPVESNVNANVFPARV